MSKKTRLRLEVLVTAGFIGVTALAIELLLHPSRLAWIGTAVCGYTLAFSVREGWIGGDDE